MVTINTILTAVSVGLGILALTSAFRPNGNNSISENQSEVLPIAPESVSNEKKINVLDSQIKFLNEQIGKAQSVINSINEEFIPTRLSASSLKTFTPPSVIRTNDSGDLFAAKAGLQNAFKTQRIEATNFIDTAKNQISLLETQKQELSV